MNEKIFEHAEDSFEAKLEGIKHEWNVVTLDVLKGQYQKRGMELPEMDEGVLLEKAPRMLEDLADTETELAQPAFIVITAPTGVGKGTIGAGLRERGIPKLPRVNTRPIRDGEAEGEEYFFVDDTTFEKMKKKGEIFCTTSTAEESKEAESAGKVDVEVQAAKTQAGIPTKEFDNYLASGEVFFIDSGAGTAKRIKQEKKLKDVDFKTVFLLPPSFDEMVRRATGRRSQEDIGKADVMSDATLLDRFSIAVNHFRRSVETADAYVVNDQAERAVDQIAQYSGK